MARNPRRSFTPITEALDSRELLASNITATLTQGILMISGTEANDFISVQISQSRQRGRWGAAPATISIAGVATTFPVSRVQLIAVDARGGDDWVEVQDFGRPLKSVWLDGGDGFDFLSGGSANDMLIGGTGDDFLLGQGGFNMFDGGSGTDTIDFIRESPEPVPLPEMPVVDPPVSNPAPTTPPAQPIPATPSLSTLEQRIFDLTNQERRNATKSELTLSDKLTQAARIHVEAMAQAQTLAHTLPGAAHPSLSDRIRHVGYAGGYAGENIAFNYLSAESVMSGWMNSTGHRENILRTEYTEIGVAVAYDAFGQPYYAQVFGRPSFA